MPKRTDISSILIIGAGPIVIGQACEFDYSGTQACKALKAEGYRVVLVNSNPATIMTDPDLADATYIEPITPEIVAKIIAKERPDALLPTMGGQTALNTALSLRRIGVLEKFGVKMIGATADAIDKAEDRELFREAMQKIGLATPRSHQVKTLIQALEALDDIGLPAIIRPSLTLGGTGAETGKRHPTIGDRVIVGAGAKILGAIKVGDDSRIGANAVVVKDVPGSAVVVGVPGQAISRHGIGGSGDASIPDLVGISLQSLLTRVARLESQADTPQTGRVIRPPEAGVWHGEDFSI